MRGPTSFLVFGTLVSLAFVGVAAAQPMADEDATTTVTVYGATPTHTWLEIPPAGDANKWTWSVDSDRFEDASYFIMLRPVKLLAFDSAERTTSLSTPEEPIAVVAGVGSVADSLSGFIALRAATHASNAPLLAQAHVLRETVVPAADDDANDRALRLDVTVDTPVTNESLLVFSGSDGAPALYALAPVGKASAPERPVAADVGPSRSGSKSSRFHAVGQSAWALLFFAVLLAIAGIAAARFGLWPLGLALFSRFAPHEILGHERRNRIFEAIRDEPGITVQALRERMGLAAGAFQHHLYQLERHGLVRRWRDGRRTLLYVRGPKFEAPRSLTPAQARVMETLRAAAPSTATELARRLGQRVQSTWQQLIALHEAGLVAGERHGRERLWSPAHSDEAPV